MFFSVVCARTLARRFPLPDVQLPSVVPVSSFDKDMVERLEQLGYVTLNQNGDVPGRMVAGARLQLQFDHCERQVADQPWFVAESDTAEFLVTDSIDRIPVIPISPKLQLRMDRGGLLSKVEVDAHNDLVRTEHDEYFFARDLSHI